MDIHLYVNAGMPPWARREDPTYGAAGQADGSQEINLSVRKIERLVGEGRDERGGHHISGQQNDPGNFFAMAIWRIRTPTSAVVTYEVRKE